MSLNYENSIETFPAFVPLMGEMDWALTPQKWQIKHVKFFLQNFMLIMYACHFNLW